MNNGYGVKDMDRIVRLIKQDTLRVLALECVYELNLPQCYLAAGFVRNLIWDHLHQKQSPTLLNDLDVIYFDLNERDTNRYLEYEAKLHEMMPQVNWQVRNQANMHERNGDNPYLSSIDAMGYWPEKETAVAIRKLIDGNYECVSAFGFESLFNLQVTHNPKRHRDVFDHRVTSKGWLAQWPALRVVRP
ncbi:conserved protein of unknown function [Vibrio tapetis subsp. tapetis]|uniref:Nitrate reductase n=2 Tax=Vibrio tapetis TaxID=52443 RepID=A0A2N8Z9A4_9VIBR|nr:conserved protein of unknown function [Vibrio tapetis subsp. tapetis]